MWDVHPLPTQGQASIYAHTVTTGSNLKSQHSFSCSRTSQEHSGSKAEREDDASSRPAVLNWAMIWPQGGRIWSYFLGTAGWSLGDARGIDERAEARDAANHPAVPRTSPVRKPELAPKVRLPRGALHGALGPGAETGRPWAGARPWPGSLGCSGSNKARFLSFSQRRGNKLTSQEIKWGPRSRAWAPWAGGSCVRPPGLRPSGSDLCNGPADPGSPSPVTPAGQDVS